MAINKEQQKSLPKEAFFVNHLVRFSNQFTADLHRLSRLHSLIYPKAA